MRIRANMTFISRGFIILWLLISCIALGGMYKLWFERERADYFGKTIEQQRNMVLIKAGISLDLYKDIGHVNNYLAEWKYYSIKGDYNQLSYLKYLLVPLIPRSATEDPLINYKLNDLEGNGLGFYSEEKGKSVTAFCISVSIVVLFSLLLKSLLRKFHFSFPELFSLSLLTLFLLVVLSKCFFESANLGFVFFTSIGLASFFYLILERFKEKKNNYLLSIPTWKTDTKILNLVVFFSFFIILLSCFWSLIMAVIVVPDEWDAWAIWGAKAKVLATGSGPLTDVSYFGHGDYPLLWPSVWAYTGWLNGGWEEVWSKGWGTVFYILFLWEIGKITYDYTDKQELAFLCPALLASIPTYPMVASWGYAEAPFWLFTTTSIGSLLCTKVKALKISRIIVGALLAFGAASTKNEGVLFALIICLTVFFISKDCRWRNVSVFVLCFILCYSPWYYWTNLANSFYSHAVDGLSFELEKIAYAIDRIPNAIEAIKKIWIDVRQWNIVLFAIFFAVLTNSLFLRWNYWVGISIGILITYFIIILFHPAEIYWQVGTSWNRLTLHSIPFVSIWFVSALGKHLKLNILN